MRLPFPDLREKYFEFKDLMSDAVYDRDGNDLLNRGLYLDLPAWGYHVFDFKEAPYPAIYYRISHMKYIVQRSN